MTVILLLIGMLSVLWFFSPLGRGVHGAISTERELTRPRFPLAALFTDSEGNRIRLVDREPLRVSGNSAAEYGIVDGDVLIAKHFNERSRKNVEADDVVIINSPKGSDNRRPWRLRKVKKIYSDRNGIKMMKFYPTPAQEVNDKPLTDAVAWIEYIRR